MKNCIEIEHAYYQIIEHTRQQMRLDFCFFARLALLALLAFSYKLNRSNLNLGGLIVFEKWTNVLRDRLSDCLYLFCRLSGFIAVGLPKRDV